MKTILILLLLTVPSTSAVFAQTRTVSLKNSKEGTMVIRKQKEPNQNNNRNILKMDSVSFDVIPYKKGKKKK